VVVVVGGLEPGELDLFGGRVQFLSDGFPALKPRLRLRAGHDHIFAAEDQVHVAGAIDILGAEILLVIMCRIALDAQVVEQFAHLLGLAFTPLEIGRIKFDALVSELGDRTDRAFGILL
jgi:hypothetical protein